MDRLSLFRWMYNSLVCIARYTTYYVYAHYTIILWRLVFKYQLVLQELDACK
jgi:hypothetical protein